MSLSLPGLPPQILTIILTTFRLQGTLGPAVFSWGKMPSFVLSVGGTPHRFIYCDSPWSPSPLPSRSFSFPLHMDRVHFLFSPGASGIHWAVHKRYKGRGLTPVNAGNHQGWEQSSRLLSSAWWAGSTYGKRRLPVSSSLLPGLYGGSSDSVIHTHTSACG